MLPTKTQQKITDHNIGLVPRTETKPGQRLTDLLGQQLPPCSQKILEVENIPTEPETVRVPHSLCRPNDV